MDRGKKDGITMTMGEDSPEEMAVRISKCKDDSDTREDMVLMSRTGTSSIEIFTTWGKFILIKIKNKACLKTLAGRIAAELQCLA